MASNFEEFNRDQMCLLPQPLLHKLIGYYILKRLCPIKA